MLLLIYLLLAELRPLAAPLLQLQRAGSRRGGGAQAPGRAGSVATAPGSRARVRQLWRPGLGAAWHAFLNSLHCMCINLF